MKIICISILLLIPVFIFCQDKIASVENANKILAKAIKAHGGKKYNKAFYQFIFRDNLYRFRNSKKGYHYSVRKTKNGQQIFDQLINDAFTRSINGNEVSLTAKEKRLGGNGLNSVIYFATLPHKLTDKSVQVSYAETVSIKDVDYYALHVGFAKEGGGEDFDDEYMYWIRKDNYQIDYFAYNYQVGKGGVRFRSANNKRIVKGILFQDYINYKAELGTGLSDLPSLYMKGQLKELSKINTEKILSIK